MFSRLKAISIQIKYLKVQASLAPCCLPTLQDLLGCFPQFMSLVLLLNYGHRAKKTKA